MLKGAFLTAFVTVLLAELGDKTQLATLGLSAGGGRFAVFLGASLALVLSSAIAVLAGEVIGRFVSPRIIRAAAGSLFLVLGFYYLRAGFLSGR